MWVRAITSISPPPRLGPLNKGLTLLPQAWCISPLPGPRWQCCSTFKQNQGVLIRAEGGIAFHLTKWHHHTVIHLEEIRGADDHVTTSHCTQLPSQDPIFPETLLRVMLVSESPISVWP